MKKLNITKEQFNRSRYFKNKYGKLEYVSESGKVYKTSKGKILKFNESMNFDASDASDALANELEIDSENDIWIDDSAGYNHYQPNYKFGVKLPDGDKATYLVYNNEESAKMAATYDLGTRFQDEPEILGSAIDYFGFETFSKYIKGLGKKKMKDLEFLSEDLGEEEFADFVQKNIDVDYRGFAEYNIEELGPEWHLADYDNEELELENGMVAYRVD